MARVGLLVFGAFVLLGSLSKGQNQLPRDCQVQQSHPAGFPKAGLQLRLSAGQVVQSNGQITLIRDSSANANDASRSADSTAPAADLTLVKDAASGQPLIHFTGANVAFSFKRVTGILIAFWVVSKDPAAFSHLDERCVLRDTVSHDFHSGWTDDTIFNVIYDNSNSSGHLPKYLHDGKTFLDGQEMDATKTHSPSDFVWAMASWKDPDLGPATSIQLLDQPGTPESLE